MRMENCPSLEEGDSSCDFRFCGVEIWTNMEKTQVGRYKCHRRENEKKEAMDGEEEDDEESPGGNNFCWLRADGSIT